MSGYAWMPDRKGTVSGFIVAGFGAGAAVFNVVATAWVNPNNIAPDPETGYYGEVHQCFIAICTILPDELSLVFRAACHSALKLYHVGVAFRSGKLKVLKKLAECRSENLQYSSVQYSTWNQVGVEAGSVFSTACSTHPAPGRVFLPHKTRFVSRIGVSHCVPLQ